MIITGGYLLMIGLNVLIPDTTKPGKVYEAYNGNIW
jgi:hypothetical protein